MLETMQIILDLDCARQQFQLVTLLKESQLWKSENDFKLLSSEESALASLKCF